MSSLKSFTSNMSHWPAAVQLFLFISLIILDQYQAVGSQKQDDEAPVALSPPPVKIVIPNLAPNHYRFWLKNHPIASSEFEKICSQLKLNPIELSPITTTTNLTYFQSMHSNLSLEDPRYLIDLDYGSTILNTICSDIDIVNKSCWGYENNCHLIYLMPECNQGSQVAKDEQEKKMAWFSQADFGYILHRRREMNTYCSADKYSNDPWISSFECTKYFRTCRGKNLFVKFHDIPKNGSLMMNNQPQYQLKEGNIGGWNCDLQLKRIQEEGGQQPGILKSWFNELKNYNIISSKPQEPRQMCDITIEKQAFIIKLDSPANMYHYFCNFLNLYATIHLNNKFSDDNEIIIWDNDLPRGKFELMWKAFSRNPLRHIGEFDGKRVCFKKFIFTLLPRMLDGLYYNAPLVSGCSKTGLFHAFNKHILHRLNVTEPQGNSRKSDKVTGNQKMIRVTIVNRSTPHRRILNIIELEKAIRERRSDYVVQLIDYASFSFQEQLRISHNTDILVGIHGAGLTNLLFLPDWASLIELHDCSDNCYKDLARLRGTSYFSPPRNEGAKENFMTKVQIEDKEELDRLNKSRLLDHEKFSNYRVVDIDNFLVLLDRASGKVRSDKNKYSKDSGNAQGWPPGLKVDPSVGNKTFVANMTTTEPQQHEEL